MGGIIPFVLQLLDALPGLINAGEEAAATIAAHRAALQQMFAEQRSPTQDEWNALNAEINSLQAQLDAPVVEPVVAPTEPPAPVEPVAAPVETPAPVAEAPAGDTPAPAA
jgi:hypothetical protein